LTTNSLLRTPCRRSISSSTTVSTNTFISTNRDFDRVESLMFLHQQAKFWAGYNRKFVLGFFLLQTMGISPLVIKCNNWDVAFAFLTLSILLWSRSLRQKGGRIIAYNTLFGIGSIKRHVEYEHLKLVISTFLVAKLFIKSKMKLKCYF